MNHTCESESICCSVLSDSLQAHGLQPTRCLCPWNSPSKNAVVGFHFLPQGIFLTQRLNPGLLHGRQILYRLSHQGRSHILLTVGTCVICAVSRASLHHSNLLTHQTLTNDCLCCSVTKLCLTLSPPQTTARQASLSFTISQSFLKLMSIELLTPSDHLSHPLPAPSPPALNLSQHQCLFP